MKVPYQHSMLIAVFLSLPVVQQEPEVSCRIRGDESFEFSSLERIPVDFVFRGTEPDLGEVAIVTHPRDSSAVPRILLRAYSPASETWYPVQVSKLGISREQGGQTLNFALEIPIQETEKRRIRGGHLQQQTVSLTLEVPIEEAEKRRMIEEWVDKMLALIPNEDWDAATRKAYRLGGITYMEPLFVQNRVGRFQIGCDLLLPSGERIDGRPLEIEIRDDGNFFDQPNLKLPDSDPR